MELEHCTQCGTELTDEDGDELCLACWEAGEGFDLQLASRDAQADPMGAYLYTLSLRLGK